jgi:GNAT superfamily N-acetyltransferase
MAEDPSPGDVLAIEMASVRAMPAVETTIIEGWTVPFGRGAVRRLNSVTTFGIVPEEPLDTIELVERRYEVRHRAANFRLTDLDAEVDDLLFARGYERENEVVVMTAPNPAAPPDTSVQMVRAATPGWLADLERMSGSDELRVAEIGEALAGLTLAHGAFSIDGAAVGLAVIDGELCGMFDVAVAEEHRRHGHGARLGRSMMSWAATSGAPTSYLQVLARNESAISMYRSLGFRPHHRYWYRAKT